jgi:hypothetical protein
MFQRTTGVDRKVAMDEADERSTARSGVTEAKANYSEALRIIGTQDQFGNHIGIVNVSWVGLRLVGLALRVLGLLAVIALYSVREPLAWLPIPDTAPAAFVELRDWQVFSLGTWLLALVLYLVYFTWRATRRLSTRFGRASSA